MIVLTIITVVSCIHISIGINIDFDNLNNTGDGMTHKVKVYDVQNAKKLFEDYVREHNKQYKDEAELQRRYEIFVEKLKEINDMNQKSRSEIYGITEFADMTVDELYNGYTGLANFSSDSSISYPSRRLLKDVEAPREFDWRQRKAVTDVKNQRNCSSCWAFSAVGLVEGQFAIKHGQLLSLSEQQMVDCWPRGGGCITGNYPHSALNAASEMGGFMKFSDYPYTGKQGRCAYRKESAVVKVRSGIREKVRGEEELKDLLYQNPCDVFLHLQAGGKSALKLAIKKRPDTELPRLQASGILVSKSLFNYKGNVYVPSEFDCPPGAVANHAVLLVGYGSENGKPYWLIKNSWGHKWGEQGYLKIIRGEKACAIATYVATGDIV